MALPRVPAPRSLAQELPSHQRSKVQLCPYGSPTDNAKGPWAKGSPAPLQREIHRVQNGHSEGEKALEGAWLLA